MMNGLPIDLIWNITRQCSWDCAICCVDAVPVDSDALRAQSRELSYSQKLSVLDNLSGFSPKVDISGGDPLAVPDALPLLEACSDRFGRRNVTVTATGATLNRLEPQFAAQHIGELNFTYDMPSPPDAQVRPQAYSKSNLSAAGRFLAAGLNLRAECPLNTSNVAASVLEHIYLDLCDAGIQTLLLTRMFPVGRSSHHVGFVPSPVQYRAAIGRLRELESRHGQPRVKLQCALRFFDNHDVSINPCDSVRLSFGLMPDGTLLASPWAYSMHGRPLDEAWVLGNLADSALKDILSSSKARYYREHLDDNFGHCKVLSWLNGSNPNPLHRVFD